MLGILGQKTLMMMKKLLSGKTFQFESNQIFYFSQCIYSSVQTDLE